MRLAEIKSGSCRIAAEQDRQFIVENLNDLLARRNASEHRFAKRFFFDSGNEFFGDVKIDIGFEQRETDLAQRRIDVLLADFSVTAETLKDLLQLVAQLRKHEMEGRAPSRPILI